MMPARRGIIGQILPMLFTAAAKGISAVFSGFYTFMTWITEFSIFYAFWHLGAWFFKTYIW